MPITPDFKGNLIARYSFPMGGFNGYTQGTLAYQESAASQLELADNAVYGDIPSSTYVNLAFGVEKDKYSVELFVANATTQRSTNEREPPNFGVILNCWSPRTNATTLAGVSRQPVGRGASPSCSISRASSSACRSSAGGRCRASLTSPSP